MSDRMMYVYGIARSGVELEAGASGLDGAPLRLVPLRDVAALVSDAPSDLRATRVRLLAHANLLSQVVVRTTVLPMRFGVVIAGESALRAKVLAPRYAIFDRLLRDLDGLVEFTVKAMYQRETVLREVLRENPAIRRLKERVASVHEAASYFDRISLGEEVARGVERKRVDDERRLYEALSSVAVRIAPDRPATEDMVAKAGVLIRRGDEARLEALVDRIQASARGRISLRIAGPHPPYSFVGEATTQPARDGAGARGA